MDDTWTVIHAVPPGIIWTGETKICPCSLTPLDPAGALVNDPARAPYWPLPDTAGQTLALTPQSGHDVFVKDCAGVRPTLIGPTLRRRGLPTSSVGPGASWRIPMAEKIGPPS